MNDLFRKIVKTCLYLLVFLLPVFWLPFSSGAFEFSKQYLLFFLTTLAFFCWLARMALREKEIRIRRSPLDIPVLAFLALAVLSSIFSVDKISSIFGFYGRFNGGLINLLSFGMLYFLITNNVSRIHFISPVRSQTSEKEQKEGGKSDAASFISGESLLNTFFYSVFPVIVLSYMTVFGVWQWIFQKFGPLKFQGLDISAIMLNRTFNPVGGALLESLAIFLAVVVLLLIGKILFGKGKGKIINHLLLTSALFLMIIIDFTAAWLVLFISLALFFGIFLRSRMFREDINRLLLPIFILFVALIFSFFNFNQFQFFPEKVSKELSVFQQNQEIILSQTDSWKIGFGAIREDAKSLFLGTGPGTWHYDFAKFKPVDFNKNWFWFFRFDRPGNHIAELLSTGGILGLLAYLSLIGFSLLISVIISQSVFQKLGVEHSAGETERGGGRGPAFERFGSGFVVLMAFIGLLISQFVYYQNITLAFMFWFLLSILVVSWQKPFKEKVFSFKDFPELSLLLNVFLVFFGLIIIGFYFFAVRFYIAEFAYVKALNNPDINEKVKLLKSAVEINPYQAQYKIILAMAYHNLILTEARKAPEEVNQVFLNENIVQAITYIKGGVINGKIIKGAAEISPARVYVWESLGAIYRDIAGLAGGALDWGVKSFSRAQELEPTNPVLYTELGKLYLAQNDLEKAKAEFEKARSLKQDYVEAVQGLSLIYEKEENFDEAIRLIADLSKDFPSNTDILFSLGRLYYNADRLDEAVASLKTAIGVAPNFSNARYVLGLIYEKQGKKDQAIAEFEKILELNPDNAEVIQALKKLRGQKQEPKQEQLEEQEQEQEQEQE